jgi:hypothetical protein
VVLFDKVTHIETSGKVDLVNKNYSSEFQTDAAIKKHGDVPPGWSQLAVRG